MSEIQRFGVSIPNDLLERFDRLLVKKGYQNRSEALRDLVRDYLVNEEAQKEKGEVLGTVTLVYDHHVTNLGKSSQRCNTKTTNRFYPAFMCI